MYVTEDFYIKNENTKMKLKKNSGLPKSTKPWKRAYSGNHVCGAGLGSLKLQMKQWLFQDPGLLPLLYFLVSLLSAFWIVSTLIPLH